MNSEEEKYIKSKFELFETDLNFYFQTGSYDKLLSKILTTKLEVHKLHDKDIKTVFIDQIIYDQFSSFYLQLVEALKDKDIVKYQHIGMFIYWIYQQVIFYYTQNYLQYKSHDEIIAKRPFNNEFEQDLEEGIYTISNLFFDFFNDFFSSLSVNIEKLEKFRDRAKQMSGAELKPEKEKIYREIIVEQKQLMVKYGSRSHRASMVAAVKSWGLKQTPKQNSIEKAKKIANNISKLQNKGSLPKN